MNATDWKKIKDLADSDMDYWYDSNTSNVLLANAIVELKKRLDTLQMLKKEG